LRARIGQRDYLGNLLQQKRRNMNAAKPAHRLCRKPIERTVGSDGTVQAVPRLSFVHHKVDLLPVTMRFRLLNRFSESGENRTAQR
jgi:hypothetical protein